MSLLYLYICQILNLIYYAIYMKTGAAAFNINGETLHRQCGVTPFNMSKDLSKDKRNELIINHKRIILFIVDERSMISSEILGACQKNIADTVYGGTSGHKEFGGIPVVMLVGDDNQLPPVIRGGKGKGAFYIFENKPISNYNCDRMKTELEGIKYFKIFSKKVMQITERRRQQKDIRFIKILEDLNTGDPSEETADILMSLHFSKLKPSVQTEIRKKAIYIFATNKDKDDHNNDELVKICNETNPLACLAYEDVKIGGGKSIRNHYQANRTPLSTYFCVGAKVALKGRNIQPRWGLFNGTIGTVKEIVYEHDNNPNLGHLPVYVAVEFPTYNPPLGVPPFHPENSKVIRFLFK